MSRSSLLEYFRPDLRPTSDTALIWRRGYRTVRWSYLDVLGAASWFAAELTARNIKKGDRVLLWGENSGEWIGAFLGCMFCGAVVVPMDAIADKSFAKRVAEQAGVRLAVIGRDLPAPRSVPALVLEDFSEAARGTNPAAFAPVSGERSDPLQIVFTSGTTAEPRGVVLTHANLLANLEPLEREIARYRRYERFVHPIRFLDLLPLSHVFGQLLGIFLPQILAGTSVFLDTLNPAEVIRTIRAERISVLVTVPRLIESLRDHLERDLESRGQLAKFRQNFETSAHEHFLRRWWRFRAIRRKFGWKFWAMISGGAALSAGAEEFWGRLGYAVIQGYGLTETASLVSVNHPFHLGRGSIGKSLPGMEIKLSDEGEILVRGESVSSGYWKDWAVSSVADDEGWFHTGDLGERDEQGNLYFKGRRKNVIVTPEGLNVFPEDLESELRKETAVRDCVVVGLERDGNAEPCAVILLRSLNESGADADARAAVEKANGRLAPFQQMRRWFVWRDADFPRTPTQKPMLRRIQEVVQNELDGQRDLATATSSGPLGDLLARVSRGRAISDDASGTLQLSSVERVDLLSALEDRYQVDLSESEFTKTQSLAGLERLIENPALPEPPYHYPRWAQTWPARALRFLMRHLLARPAMLLLGWPRVRGRENLQAVRGPILVVANHTEYFDPAYILEGLPERLRGKLAVAMDGERLEGMRNPAANLGFFTGLAYRAGYWLVILAFNVFPLPRRAGFRKSFAFAGELVDRRWSVLIFPEGELTTNGNLSPFRAGIGLLATRLDLPVVPVRISGLFELKAAGKRWARPGQVTVSIGPPVRYSKADAAEKIAGDLEQRVEALKEGPGA
jgi:long-chain acyl-CoA synthetase